MTDEIQTMADETTVTTETPANAATQTANGTQAQNNATEHMIPKSRFDEINTELKQLKTEQARLQKEREAAEQKALAEQGKFKELYEKEKAEREAALAKAREMERDNLRREVAREAGYPSLWNRLQGETEDEIKADMETLKQSLPAPAAPDLNAGAGASPSRTPGRPVPNMAQIKEQAAVLGVNPRFLAEQYGLTWQE